MHLSCDLTGNQVCMRSSQLSYLCRHPFCRHPFESTLKDARAAVSTLCISCTDNIVQSTLCHSSIMARHALAGQGLLASLLSIAALATADGTACYSRALGNVLSGEWLTCHNTARSIGGAQSCCMAGSQCGPDSMCHIPSSLASGNASWYPSGCTDPTYQDPVCRLDCSECYLHD